MNLTERDELVRRYLHFVKPIASQLQKSLPAGLDLADLIQEGTIGLIQAIESYDGSSPLEFWIRAKVRGAILNAIKGEQFVWASRTQSLDTVVELPAPSPSDLESEVLAAMSRLELREQRVLELHYVRGLSIQQIGQARMLGVGVDHCRKIHASAIRKLRRPLERRARANVVEMVPKAA